jgi:hypothetical protein
MRQAHDKHLFNIFFIIIVRRGKGREMEWRSGRRDGRGDGTVCEGIVPLGNQGSGKAEGKPTKVFFINPASGTQNSRILFMVVRRAVVKKAKKWELPSSAI